MQKPITAAIDPYTLAQCKCFYIKIYCLSVATVKIIHEIIFKNVKCPPRGEGGKANRKFALARDSKSTDCWLMPLVVGFYPNFDYRLTK